MAEENKIHTTIRLSASVIRAAKQQAQRHGITLSLAIDHVLLAAYGIKDWPKPPKGMKKAKEIAKR
jgi:hypothetical protein